MISYRDFLMVFSNSIKSLSMLSIYAYVKSSYFIILLFYDRIIFKNLIFLFILEFLLSYEYVVELISFSYSMEYRSSFQYLFSSLSISYLVFMEISLISNIAFVCPTLRWVSRGCIPLPGIRSGASKSFGVCNLRGGEWLAVVII